jgi:hypothetical protein
MNQEIHQYAIPLDEHEPDPGELEYVDINDPRLTTEEIVLNPDGDAFAPSMLKETVSDDGEVEVSLVNCVSL